MKLKDTYDYVIPVWALSALINGDYSGLTDQDIARIEKFNQSLPKPGTLTVPEGDPFFSWRNDIDGPIGADVYDCKYLVFEEPNSISHEKD